MKLRTVSAAFADSSSARRSQTSSTSANHQTSMPAQLKQKHTHTHTPTHQRTSKTEQPRAGNSQRAMGNSAQTTPYPTEAACFSSLDSDLLLGGTLERTGFFCASARSLPAFGRPGPRRAPAQRWQQSHETCGGVAARAPGFSARAHGAPHTLFVLSKTGNRP